MRVTVHIIWGSIAVSHYRAGLIDIAVKLAHAAYDFFSEEESKAFIFGISEARKPDEWAVIENPNDIRRIGMPLRSALIEAAKRGDVSAVKGLLEMGVHPDGADQQGMTALHYAARNGQGDVVETLINGNADVNLHSKVDQTTPLHLCAEGTSDGHARAMDALLNANAHTEAPDVHGNRPLHYAARSGNLNGVTKMLGAGAKPSVMNNFSEYAHEVAAMQQKMDEFRTAKGKRPSLPISASLVFTTTAQLHQEARRDASSGAARALAVVAAIRAALQEAIEAEKQKQAALGKLIKSPNAHPSPFNGSGY